jgi:hypothetical protein
MSALPHETPPQAYASPYRLQAAEGPQSIAELKAALAVLSPPDLAAFSARLDAAQLAEVPAIITEYRHVWALRTRPEVQTAIQAAVDGAEPTMSLDQAFGGAAAS